MKIALLGDIALFGVYDVKENGQLEQKLRQVCSYLGGFDLVVGNLESPFSQKRRISGAKSAYIFSDPQNGRILDLLHINAVNLANNHIFDFGDEGYRTTLRVLEEYGIGHFGDRGNTICFEKEGNTIRLSGYCCYSTNPLRLSANGINKYNPCIVSEDLKRTDDCLNIVSVHAGLEHVNYPSPEHAAAARRLADACPFVYYGHHPHVIQGLEEYNGSLIAHSLGNFCFDDIYKDGKPFVMMTENERTGMILELEVRGNRVVGHREQAIRIGSDGGMELLSDGLFIEAYSKALEDCGTEEYRSMRAEILAEAALGRKADRNIRWYLKRLTPRYARLYLDMKRNARAFAKNIGYHDGL